MDVNFTVLNKLRAEAMTPDVTSLWNSSNMSQGENTSKRNVLNRNNDSALIAVVVPIRGTFVDER